ncbi:MAG: signal recognition particle-docking protein FtsY [Candidatus Pelagibacter sp. TMED166]|nr:MAG: signal recognition particle-docking protein FtsY [Candidatus Pelagibacter sp. TMED166]|tara:strand:+ start:46 stop:933 length:888 start_codon:yes stop_codon:yes gene_type:complete
MFSYIKKTFSGLKKTRNNIVNTFTKFHGKRYLNQNELEELESTLFQSDLGIDIIDKVVDEFRDKKFNKDVSWEDEFIGSLKTNISLDLNNDEDVKVLLLVGVNGTGKTTTSAKLSNYYKNKSFKTMLVGADTYRAAAVNQLRLWSEKLGIKFISNEFTKDPASIVYDALNSGLNDGYNKIIIDTAGRLHNSVNLMQELKKLYNVANKFKEKVKVVLVVDSNVGQNGMNQAIDFNKFLPLDSLILTKMDGTARGGIALSMINKLNIPIDFIGVGEDVEDLVPFNLDLYLKGLVTDE